MGEEKSISLKWLEEEIESMVSESRRRRMPPYSENDDYYWAGYADSVIYIRLKAEQAAKKQSEAGKK